MTFAVRQHNVTILGRVSAQPMVFAHGFGCDQTMWSQVADAFAADFRVVLFDHVGAGASDLGAYNTTKYSSLDGYAEDVVDLCGELDLQNVVLVGHSVSSMIGVLAVNQAPPQMFDKLVMVAPSPRYLNDDGYVGGFERGDIEAMLEQLDANYLGWSAAMAPVIMANDDRPELTDRLAQSFCRTDPAIARAFAKVTFLSDNRGDLRHVNLPTLVLQCARDAIAPMAVGEFVHEQTAGSRIAYLAATGHCPQVSAPGETIDAIRTFV